MEKLIDSKTDEVAIKTGNTISDSEKEVIPCPNCYSVEVDLFHQDGERHPRRNYWRCRHCDLTFVPSKFHLSVTAEKAEYDLHQNSPSDAGYRKFLSRISERILNVVHNDSHGLDFGCGPGPTLFKLFEGAGHRMSVYDQFYALDRSVLSRQYDFVTATEVIEHFRRPDESLNQMWNCLRPGGVLGIMTKQVLGKQEFVNWHYKNDLTHVSFFSRKTFEWLANAWGAKAEYFGTEVVLLRKEPAYRF